MPLMYVCGRCREVHPQGQKCPLVIAEDNQRSRKRQREHGRDTRHWRRIAAAVKTRDRGCVRCGATTRLTVHLNPAMEGRHEYATEADCMTLCLRCHGQVDVVVELERPAPSLSASKGARVLRAVSRFASTPDELVAELDDDGYHACGDTLAVREQAEKAAVLEVLVALGEAPAKKLAEETGLSESNARRRADALVDEGRACRHGAGGKADPIRWRPT